ncbi:MAG: helix-turn-helix transcriptional regulator [Proteobacteria bacterium]|nr:helix-turn-helix transcriptional regulator [Pseudomonadota bacterium]
MTYPDAMKLLIDKSAELGQAEVARRLGLSGAAISQILSGKYNAAPDAILSRVIEVFGGLSVECPVLGQIPMARCAEKRKLPFAATNPQRVALFRACQKCPQNGGKP